MKRNRFALFAAVALIGTGSMVMILQGDNDDFQIPSASQVSATFSGTVTEVSPEKLVIAGASGAIPTSYSQSKLTEYVDESGAPLAPTVVQTGVPVTVHYSEENRRMVARKVVVKRQGNPPGQL
jgi:hypothetical protein